jgi:hypothetical protein
MDALVSGQAGRAVCFDEDNRAFLIEVNSPRTLRSSCPSTSLAFRSLGRQTWLR